MAPRTAPRIEAPASKLRFLAELYALDAERDRENAAIWLHDPEGWAEAHGVWLWAKPREMLRSVRDHRRTVVHAGHGISKSHTAAVAAAWWIDTRHHLGTVRVITTADTGAQVRGVLWQEIGRLHASAGLVGRVNQSEWWIGSEMVGLGRKPSDTDSTAFQGFHAEYLLVIIDEMAGVPSDLLTAAESLASGDEDRILAMGNPDYSLSPFAKLCAPDSAWNVLHFDVLDSPNFTGQTDVPENVARALTGHEYVDSIVKDYGKNSTMYLAKVRGLFPEDAEGALVKREWINDNRVDFAPPMVRIAVGVDPSTWGPEAGKPHDGSGRGVETGIVVAGLTEDGHVYVLEDLSLRGSPDDWARAAIEAYRRVRANAIVPEVNIGPWVVSTLRGVEIDGGERANIVPVHAAQNAGKKARLEPVAGLYQAGRIHHVGDAMPLLESQLASWDPRESWSPDRLDALVWAVTWLEPWAVQGGGISTSALLGAGSVRRR